jgi:exopolysaccharide biosynthesis protein
MLLENGMNLVPHPGDRHPRSAVGVDASGRWVTFVVVDGRQEGYSIGATLFELAELLRLRGCSDAINMDGGGSSIMIAAEGDSTRIVNSPSDGESRPIPAMLGIRRVVRFQPLEPAL